MADGLVQRIAGRVRQHGVRGATTLALDHLEDWIFDLVHRTDTYTIIEQSDLKAIGPHQRQAREYAPTRSRSIRHAFRHFSLPTDGTFVDLGSGKGKALFVAARYGFKRVVGVEFVRSLVDIAESNAARMRKRLPHASIENHCMDATGYRFGPDVTVLYLFDPFGPDVMRQVLINFAASLAEYPRRIWVVYTNPVLLPLLKEHLPVQERRRFGAGFQESVLLSNE